MPRGPLTRLRPNYSSPYEPRGCEPRFPRSPRGSSALIVRAGVSPGSASPGVGAPFAGILKGGPHRRPGAIRGRGELDRSFGIEPTPPGPAAPWARAVPVADRPRPRAKPPAASPHSPARAGRSAAQTLAALSRRARRLRSVPAPHRTAPDRTGPDRTRSPSRPNPQAPLPRPDRRLFSSASNRHRPPRAPRPAPLRPAPRPGSGHAGTRTYGRRGRARCPPPVRPASANSWGVPAGASQRLPAVLPLGSHCAPSPVRLSNVCFFFFFFFLEGLPEPLWHCGGHRPQGRDPSP